MSVRTHNIFFSLHTVTGIVISVGLFVIFFAGAFALFEPEIHHWEEKEKVSDLSPVQYQGRDSSLSRFDYDSVLSELAQQGYYLSGRDISFMRTGIPGEISVSMGASEDSLVADKDRKWQHLIFNTRTGEIHTHEDTFSLGHFFVDLHFFGQLGKWGYYLAGLISFFFLFAIVTGTIVHWKKIASNFFVFRPWAKIKTMWTDAHTTLGIIGLPFQFMYALTGAYFCLSILVSGPAVKIVYDGDRGRYFDEFSLWPDYPMAAKSDTPQEINPYVRKTLERWPGYEPMYVSLRNYGNTNMHLQIDGQATTKDRLIGFGTIIYRLSDDKVVRENDPFHSDYVDGVPKTVWMLHYGEFDRMVSQASDFFFRTVYFLLALMTCFVIITGVLVWLEARNKKSIPEKQRKFNAGVGHIYLAICLSMFPVTAFSFIASKLFPSEWIAYRDISMNSIYFGGWLLLSAFFWLKKDNYFTNKYTLLSGGVLSLLVPLASGLYSGNWIWHTYALQHYDVFMIDLIWLASGVAALFTVSVMTRKAKASEPAYEEIAL